MRPCRLTFILVVRLDALSTWVDLLDCLKAPQIATTVDSSTASRLPIALSIHRRWSRECDPIENFADKKVSLNGGQLFSYDLVVEPQTKQASRVAWTFKLNDNPLD